MRRSARMQYSYSSTTRWPRCTRDGAVPSCSIVRRLVSVADNYDALGYPPDDASRDARYTRYVTHDRLLRTQMSALIRDLTRTLTAAEANALRDEVYAALHEGSVKIWAGNS